MRQQRVTSDHLGSQGDVVKMLRVMMVGVVEVFWEEAVRLLGERLQNLPPKI